MNDHLTFRQLQDHNISKISNLGQQLNPNLSLAAIKQSFVEMFQCPNYHCFGLFLDKQLIGISSGWITVRLYSGRQLEIDNVVIDDAFQSNGYGKQFFTFVEKWAKKHNCKTIELNTYVQNSKSHKFYFNMDYSILGFHFWKTL